MARRKRDGMRVATIESDAKGPAPTATEGLPEGGDIDDRRHVHDIKTGQRRVVVLPSDLCRRLAIDEGTPLRLIEHDGYFEVIPMRLVAAHNDSARALDALLERVTTENTHEEVETGPAVGRESW